MIKAVHLVSFIFRNYISKASDSGFDFINNSIPYTGIISSIIIYLETLYFPFCRKPTRHKNNALHTEEKARKSVFFTSKRKYTILMSHNKSYSQNTLNTPSCIFKHFCISTLMKRKKKWRNYYFAPELYSYTSNQKKTQQHRNEKQRTDMRRRQLKVKAFSGLIIAS